MTDATVAELMVRSLEKLGVNFVCGNPGTTELPFVKAITESNISYRLALHEDVAVGIGAGHSITRSYPDFSGNNPPLSVVNLHTSGGLSHGLANIYGSCFSRAPVLIIVGTQSTDFRHQNPILSGNCQAIVDQFSRWSGEITHPNAAMEMLEKAIRKALTPPQGPTCLMVPLNIFQSELNDDPVTLGSIPSPGLPDDDSIRKTTRACLDTAELGVVFGDEIGRLGQPAIKAAKEFIEASKALVFGEILAAECNFPSDHPDWISILPPDVQISSQLLDLETIIFVGCNHQTGLFENSNGLLSDSTTCIQINTSTENIGGSISPDIAVSGNLVKILDELTDNLEGKLSGEYRKNQAELLEATKGLVDAKLNEMRISTNSNSDRCNQRNVVEVLNEINDDAIIVDEGVTGRFELLTEGDLKPERYFSNKGGALGYGLPASIGSAMAVEESSKNCPVIAYVGDGSFWYYPQSLHTASRYSLNLTVLILRNNRYQILEDNAENILGNKPDFDSTKLKNLSASQAGDAQNVDSYTVKRTDDLRKTLQKELDNHCPSIIEIKMAE